MHTNIIKSNKVHVLLLQCNILASDYIQMILQRSKCNKILKANEWPTDGRQETKTNKATDEETVLRWTKTSNSWWRYSWVSASNKVKTRNSSGDKIANVNFRCDDIVHVLQNTIDSCINSATDRRGYVLEHMFTKFCEITQYNGHYVVQGHSRSPILVPFESSYTTSY